ncbi:MAG: hypothetical protein E5X53_32005 [Mesorhizobium sp.]|uniref:hypothetical protein n=1 Tax=Mesorhizobium sp. TaxID=1871066 RepID=UPI000FE86DEA|nr:hypothetical protein [Mesorhizobium sp.]RWM15216.1 MAG: hypothetical protein EOR73_24880 [Mesorhizobium sp.]TIP69574.1 MAG: hypothetical protein E5X55_31520 [Mesorhizobium sp.]TIQ03754.1 MAG: hypothetical protein E5X57_30495 [Mesorhizobium sp.]TIR47903.1 MAG: hypothetical protein E5X53_32005 [Mesorhizobium sp.]TJV95799.1 MAG: hypothetical protein E5X52_21855 [Mesorhizobium sp.]
MTTARQFEIIDNGPRELARLRPADGHAPGPAAQMAGPFEVAADKRTGPTMRDALITGLLVIYPAFATLAAIIAGLFLAGASGT